MVKAVVVDDEKMIRQGIRDALPWEALGVGEVFTAASGREALEVLEQHQPEIMITDINMAEMTGLELIEQAKQIVECLRIIVLTGFDDFEYARQCLRMHVEDFFLKPIDEDVLKNAIQKQVGVLNQLSRDKKNQLTLRRTQGTAEQTYLERTLRNLVHGRAESGELDRLCSDYHLNPGQPVQVAILVPALYMDSAENKDNFVALSVKNICIGLIDARDSGITFMDDDGKIIIAFFDNGQANAVVEQIEELNNILRDEFKMNPRVVLGSVVEGFQALPISYNDAVYLMEHETEEILEIVRSGGAHSREDLFQEIFAEIKSAMCRNIGNSDYLLRAYDAFGMATQSYNLTPANVRRCCFDLASSVYFTYISESGKEPDEKLDALLRTLAHTDREEACEVTHTFLSQLVGMEEANVHEIVTKSKRYIDEHLPEDLSVSSIAAGLYITPNYFSRLFKHVTGEGCNEYIVRKRIDLARSLLETTNIKTGKIAMAVGYRDTNYFSLAFKKHTGMSPTKYREKIRGAS